MRRISTSAASACQCIAWPTRWPNNSLQAFEKQNITTPRKMTLSHPLECKLKLIAKHHAPAAHLLQKGAQLVPKRTRTKARNDKKACRLPQHPPVPRLMAPWTRLRNACGASERSLNVRPVSLAFHFAIFVQTMHSAWVEASPSELPFKPKATRRLRLPEVHSSDPLSAGHFKQVMLSSITT